MAEQGVSSDQSHLPPCRLPLAFLPDGALEMVLSFGSVAELVAANTVCRTWVIDGNRFDLWKALGEAFEVTMPISLGSRAGARPGDGGRGSGKRVLRSGANAKRTFFKSYAASIKSDRLKHDATLSEAYTLFRAQDSVQKLRSLLRRRWEITFDRPCSRAGRRKYVFSSTLGGGCQQGARGAGVSTYSGGSSGSSGSGIGNSSTSSGASLVAAAGNCRTTPRTDAWHGRGRWTLDVNHRHGIWEGNTLLNFAVRCGRRKCVEFLMRQMGADTEIPDYGGFTPLLNTAWRGDIALLKQLLDGGARLDVHGVSRGDGPYSPLEWAERKDRPSMAAFLRGLAGTEGAERAAVLEAKGCPRKRDAGTGGGDAAHES